MENGRRKAAGCPRGRGPLPEATRGRRTGRWLPVGSRMRLGTCLGRVGGEGRCRRGRLPSGARPAARGCTRLLQWAAAAGMALRTPGNAGAGDGCGECGIIGRHRQELRWRRGVRAHEGDGWEDLVWRQRAMQSMRVHSCAVALSRMSGVIRRPPCMQTAGEGRRERSVARA